MKPILLRRTKNIGCVNGEQILEEKSESIVWIDLNQQERYIYDLLIEGT